MFIHTASIMVFFEMLKAAVLATHEQEEGCVKKHRKLSNLLDCTRNTLDPRIAQILTTTPIEGINHMSQEDTMNTEPTTTEEQEMDYTEPTWDQLVAVTLADIKENGFEIVGHLDSDGQMVTYDTPIHRPYVQEDTMDQTLFDPEPQLPAEVLDIMAEDEQYAAQAALRALEPSDVPPEMERAENGLPPFVPKEDKMKMNVRAITKVEGRNFHVIPEMINVEFTNHDELVMMLQAMAHEANVIGYTGILNHHMLVVTRTEAHFEVSGRIIPNQPQRTSTSQRFTAYWVYGVIDGESYRVYRTGAKFTFWADDKHHMKAVVQEKLSHKHSGIVAGLIYSDDDRFYVTREVAKPIRKGIVRRRAFNS